jgi:hypothetical protein
MVPNLSIYAQTISDSALNQVWVHFSGFILVKSLPIKNNPY